MTRPPLQAGRVPALLTFVALVALTISSARAQQAERSSSIGLRAGVTTYYGELNDDLFPARPELIDLGDNLDYLTWGVDLERYFGNGWGVGLLYTNAQFSASDREVDWDGNLQADAEDFGRALNVSTSINDLAAYGIWSANDGRLLSETAFLAPFVKFGLGVTRYQTRGDLFAANGNRYIYTDGTDVLTVGPADSPILLPEGTDGVYETELRDLETSGVDYSQYAYHLLGGLGLNFRISDYFSLQLETIARFTTTDHLDDVGGSFQNSGSELRQYASAPAGEAGFTRGEDGSDSYALTTLTARFHLGDRSDEFRTPLILTGDLPLQEPDSPRAARLFRFEPLEPLPATPSIALVREPIVFRPQGALSVPRPTDSTLAGNQDEAPPIENMAAADYEVPDFDPEAFGADPADTLTTAAAPPVVSTYPPGASDDSLALDPSVTERLDSLGDRLDALGRELTAPTDSLEIDSLYTLTEPAAPLLDSTALAAVELDSAAAAELDSVDVVLAARGGEIDSLQSELAALVDAPDSLAADSLAEVADTSALVLREAEVERLRMSIDSLQRLRARDERLREDVARQRRAEIARLRDEDDRRTSERPATQVRERATERERRPAAATAGDERAIRELAEDQRELRRQLAELTDALRQQVAASAATTPAVAQAPAPTPSAPAVAPPAQAGATDAAVLAELQALRSEVATLRAAQATAATAAAPTVAPAAAPAPSAPAGGTMTATDPRVAVVEALAAQQVRRVFFETAQAEVTTAGLTTLSEAADVAMRYPGYVVVRLEGFTDPRGSQQLNQQLSERRVRAVRTALEQLGVSAAQIEIAAQGEDFDVSDLAFGRRVEVRLGVR